MFFTGNPFLDYVRGAITNTSRASDGWYCNRLKQLNGRRGWASVRCQCLKRANDPGVVLHFGSANTCRSNVKSMTASTFTSLPVVCLISPNWVLIALSLPNPSGLTDLIERVYASSAIAFDSLSQF